jgi:hypothetical protein
MIPLVFLLACTPQGDTDPTVKEAEIVYPRLWITPDDKALVLDRLSRDPYDDILESLTALADREYEEPNLEVWDHSAHGHNGETAQANALMAYLFDDGERGEKALSFLSQLPDDFETNATWDVNIRMPHSLIGYTDTVDLLRGTEFITADEVADAEERLTTINGKFYERYILTDLYRNLVLAPSQNNHPIRTASAMGYVALAFPDHPESDDWLNWAVSELDYLWSANGQYVQSDGGISEGPFYYGFGFGVSMAFFIAADHVFEQGQIFKRDCINRQDVEPWAGHGCIDGEEFEFENPLYSDLFPSTMDWSISLRLPWGHRAPLGDGRLRTTPNGGSLLTYYTGEGHYRWDWENNLTPRQMTHGANLIGHHLLYLDEEVEPKEPDWVNRFMADAGNAIFRSGWDDDDLFLLLVAEEGSARMSLHDHVDGTSFQMAAYGEYLLIDPGYYKPNELNNARTSAPEAHNVVLIDGHGAPDKGLLTDFGDKDAFLKNFGETEHLAYSEAHQNYENTDIERSVLFVDNRYFIVADRLSTAGTDSREHRWRLNGWAGQDLGYTFDLRGDGLHLQRDLAGVDVFLAATEEGLVMDEPPFVEWEAPYVHELDGDEAHHGVMDGVVHGVAPRFLAVLAPYRTGVAADDQEAPLTVTPVELDGKTTSWTVSDGTNLDWVILREEGTSETFGAPTGESITTDGELVFVRLEGSDPLALLVRGTSLTLDGTTLATATAAEAFTFD